MKKDINDFLRLRIISKGGYIKNGVVKGETISGKNNAIKEINRIASLINEYLSTIQDLSNQSEDEIEVCNEDFLDSFLKYVDKTTWGKDKDVTNSQVINHFLINYPPIKEQGETRIFGGKDDKQFWAYKPIQKNHPKMRTDSDVFPDTIKEQDKSHRDYKSVQPSRKEGDLSKAIQSQELKDKEKVKHQLEWSNNYGTYSYCPKCNKYFHKEDKNHKSTV